MGSEAKTDFITISQEGALFGLEKADKPKRKSPICSVGSRRAQLMISFSDFETM